MRTYWCVACGPSLRHQDLGFLAERRVIAVNRAHERIPRPYEGHIWFSDWRFWAEYQERLRKRIGWKLHTVNDPAHRPYPLNTLTVWRNAGLQGLATHPGRVCTGNNGGYAALNLAYHLGAERIVLLGYDMKLADDGAAHWHEEHSWGAMRARTLRDKMRPYFPSMAEALAMRGLYVYNATPGSALECFPRISLDYAKERFGDPLQA